jgi:hypothetical protein
VIWLFGAMGGLLVSAALLLFGLRVDDLWLAVIAGVAAVAFVGAVVVFARAL